MIICSLTPVVEQSLRKCLFTFLHLHNLDSRGEGLWGRRAEITVPRKNSLEMQPVGLFSCLQASVQFFAFLLRVPPRSQDGQSNADPAGPTRSCSC